jgi:hypothetical protein
MGINSPVTAQKARQTISHQGVLLDNSGDPVADDTKIFSFKIYADSAGGNALWENDKILDVEDGMFSTKLGSEQALGLSFDQQYWVGIAIDGGEELVPRMPLSATPYAFHAYTVADRSVTNEKIVDGAVTEEKLADSLQFTHHHSFGQLHQGSVDVTTSWTKLDIGNSPRTFVKQHSSTKVEVVLNSRARTGSFNGARAVDFELRIDGKQAPITIRNNVYSSDTREPIYLQAVFNDLSAGEHSVEVWAQGIGGSSSDILIDPGGYGGKILVTETR